MPQQQVSIRKLLKGEEQVQVNKWIRGSLTFLLIVISGILYFASSIDWSKLGLTPEQVAGIGGAIAAMKFVINLIAPSSEKATVPTGGTVITQRATT